MCKMVISPGCLFFQFSNFDFPVCQGAERAKNDVNYLFQYVMLCISGTVDHIIEILLMISTGVFLYFLYKKTTS